MHPLIILAGPTASGKSKLAEALAEHFDSEIISADSMQVYKYFDIGTAKPSRELRERIPHHLVDILEPDEEFTAFDFKERALRHIRDMQARDKIPIMVGGTGLYLKTLVENYECAVEVSPEVRVQIRDEIREKGPQAAHAELLEVDPEYARKIEPTDRVRIERALAVFRETGKPLSEFHADNPARDYEFDIHYFLLETDRTALYANIDKRVDRMIQNGLREEVETLLARGFSPDLKPFQSIGYAQMLGHLQSQMDWKQTVHEIKRDTRHYAKRQITWFKKVPGALPVPTSSQDTAITLRGKILSKLASATVALGVLLLTFLGTVPAARAQGTESPAFKEIVQQFHKGRLDAARAQLDRILESSPEDPTQNKRARYLLAHTLLRENKFSLAEEAWRTLLPLYPQMEDYIRFHLAQALWKSNQPEKALLQVDHILSEFPRTRLIPRAGLLRAELLTTLNRPKEAIQQYRRLEKTIQRQFKGTPFMEDIPKILFRQLQLWEQIGKVKRAHEVCRRLHVYYPTHDFTQQSDLKARHLEKKYSLEPWELTRAEQGRRIRGLLNEVKYNQGIREIKALKKSGKKEPLPSKFYFYLANAYQGKRRRAKAIRVLREFLEVFPEHRRTQEAHFQIGRNLWNLGNPRGALERFKTVLQLGESKRWSAQGHFFMARIYEDLKQYDNSIQHYRILIQRYSDEKYAEMGAWRIGWIHYLSGKLDAARDQFKLNTEKFSDGLLVEKNYFWLAKIAEQQGRTQEAQSIYRTTFGRFPFTYYGLQARNKLEATAPTLVPEGNQASIQKTAFRPAETHEVSIGRKLTSRERFHLSRTRELVALGFYKDAHLELAAMANSVRKNQRGVLWLSHWYNEARAYSDSQRLLQLFKDFKTKPKEKDLPEQFWRNFYPSAYSEPISIFSQKYKIDPLLVRSLIRQESMYDTWSISQAGARGLMQIMPKTGQRLARNNGGSRNFNPDVLFDPETNIQLGIQYLGQLTRRYKNNKRHILISYNAGPKVLRAWLRRFRSIKDPDIFVESIPYPETRKYVKKVLRNYEIYKILYSTPSTASSPRQTF